MFPVVSPFMETLLLDTKGASELRQHHVWVAEAIDSHRAALTRDLAVAATLTNVTPTSILSHLLKSARQLRRSATQLNRRVVMVLFGGPDMNAGLWAVAQFREHFATIESQGETPDGIATKADLQWAAANLENDAALAAQWLLDHPTFLALLDAPEHNTHYLASPSGYTDLANLGQDGRISRADLQTFEDKVAAYAILRPLLPFVDTAAHGGDADEFVSQEDLQSFLATNTLPADVVAAVQTVLNDGAYHQRPWVDPETLLFAAGLVPVVGDLIDGAFALYYLSTGNATMAAIYAVGLIPIPGVSGGAIRATKETAETLQDLGAREARDYLAKEIATNYVAGELGASTADLTADLTDNPYLISASDRAASVGGGRLLGGSN